MNKNNKDNKYLSNSCVCFDHTCGWISQICFDVEVGGISILESGAVHCVHSITHLARDLLESAALERLGLLEVGYLLVLQALQLRDVHVRAVLPLYLDIRGVLVADQVESCYLTRWDDAPLFSADDSILCSFITAAQKET